MKEAKNAKTEELLRDIKSHARSLKKHPNNDALHYAKAGDLVKLGNETGNKSYYNAALTSYTRAIELSPQNRTYLVDRSKLYIILERPDLAAQDIVEAQKAPSTGDKVLDMYSNNTAKDVLKLSNVQIEVKILLSRMSPEVIDAVANSGNIAPHMKTIMQEHLKTRGQAAEKSLESKKSPETEQAKQAMASQIAKQASVEASPGSEKPLPKLSGIKRPEWVKLVAAIQEDDAQLVQSLLDETPGLINEKGVNGKTALHYATQAGSGRVIVILLKRNPDLANIVDDYGWTALFFSALNGQQVIIDMLLPGMNPEAISAVDTHGRTTLHLAASNGYDKIVKTLLPRMNPKAIDAATNSGNIGSHIKTIMQEHLKLRQPISEESSADSFAMVPSLIDPDADNFDSVNPEALQSLMGDQGDHVNFHVL